MYFRFEAILFDLGGTLWEASGGKPRDKVVRNAAMRAAQAILGTTRETELAERLSLAIVHRMNAPRIARERANSSSYSDEIFAEDDIGSILEAAASPFGGKIAPDITLEFGHDLTRDDANYPETVAVLKRIRETRPEIRIGIVSNTVVQPEVIDFHLARTGLLELVDFRILSSELGWRKPHPAIYAAALAKSGVDPRSTLFVGDRPLEDVMGPSRIGMKAVLRSSGPDGPDLPAGCHPVAVVRDLREVLPLLEIE